MLQLFKYQLLITTKAIAEVDYIYNLTDIFISENKNCILDWKASFKTVAQEKQLKKYDRRICIEMLFVSRQLA